MEDNYEPFGIEWELEVMKIPKKVIVDMYRKSRVEAISEIASLKSELDQLKFENQMLIDKINEDER